MFCLYYILFRICVFWTQIQVKCVTWSYVTHFDQYGILLVKYWSILTATGQLHDRVFSRVNLHNRVFSRVNLHNRVFSMVNLHNRIFSSIARRRSVRASEFIKFNRFQCVILNATGASRIRCVYACASGHCSHVSYGRSRRGRSVRSGTSCMRGCVTRAPKGTTARMGL